MSACSTYVLVKDPAAARRVSSAWMAGDIPLPKEEMQYLLSELLHKPVSLQLVESPGALADELVGTSRDAVAIFGEEPFQLMDEFRAAYTKKLPTNELRILTNSFPRASSGELRRASQVGVWYTLLSILVRRSYGDLKRVETGISDAVVVGFAYAKAEPSRARFYTSPPNAKSLGNAVPECCRHALRSAIGDAALVTARTGNTPPEMLATRSRVTC